MKTKNYLHLATLFIALSICNVACNQAPTEATTSEVAVAPVAAKADMVKIKSEIQQLENAWAAADNASDVTALLAFYSEDAVSMGSESPMAVGKAAIQKQLETSMSSRPEGVTVKYETLDVFGDENTVTEVGKSTQTDASGKVISNGKYMAIWEKRDGKYVCVRDIFNSDSKED